MSKRKLPAIALLWEQFAPYHIDRIEAVAQRLKGRAEVLAVEVATASETYNWPPSGPITGARKQTLFPQQTYESAGWWRRLWAQLGALWGCHTVLVGIGYDRPDILLLSWILRLTGHRVVMMSDSKYDDRPRTIPRELGKRILLACYQSALVAGKRQESYFRSLGFARKQILFGYDTINIDRIRQDAAAASATPVPFDARHFLFVGRFVPKKNVIRMLDAYARYAGQVGPHARKLRLVGSGMLEAEMRQHCTDLGITDQVEFLGFLDAPAIAAAMSASLALILISIEEQWGLVVNEATALGIPVLVSSAVGSSDALVRNLRNGYIFEPDAIDGLARAMGTLASDQTEWHRMAAAADERAWLADSNRFADSVEFLFGSVSEQTTTDIARLKAALAETV